MTIHVLLFAVHHIVFDGWSMGVLWSELSACYEAICQGKQISLPKLAIQYADYARWQRDRLQNHRCRSSRTIGADSLTNHSLAFID